MSRAWSLQPSAGALECVIYRKSQVTVAFIRFWRTSDIDLAAIRQREPDTHQIPTTGLMMSAGTFYCNPGRNEPSKTAFQFGYVLIDGRSQVGWRLDASEFDLSRRLHGTASIVAIV